MSNNGQSNRSSPSKGSAAERLLRDLIGIEGLTDLLCDTAPLTCARKADAQSIISKYAVRTGAGFWSLGLNGRGEQAEKLWEEMTHEHQRRLEGVFGFGDKPAF
ncbi:MAG: hypothetical protein BroJett024_08770 [Alphaproteobacteria bacterium]|nr:MAG: hypothetical protein BroJett024_08770 [Alphaproteobacteria bacterium]